MPQPTSAPHDAGAIERSEALHGLVLRSLDDDKAVDVVSIPLSGKSNIADYMVIASGRSTRQVAAMAHKHGVVVVSQAWHLGSSSGGIGLPESCVSRTRQCCS